jgi:hypothetical protein
MAVGAMATVFDVRADADDEFVGAGRSYQHTPTKEEQR